MTELKLAKWWENKPDDAVLCTLCPRYCLIREGQKGFCYIRQNNRGKLFSRGYGRPSGFAVDPIEKKPLNHFLPGTEIFSFGTAGCNLGCKFCQNWTLSKSKSDDQMSVPFSPEEVVKLAIKMKCPSIAITYNDPVIIGEYVIDISKLAREHGIKTVMVTAGYITEMARKEVFQFVDGANVDLKAFTETFYYKMTSGHLANVLDTLIWLKKETDIWFEITTLLIPGENDSVEEIKEMCGWILENLGENIPIHFTAFHPDFHLKDRLATSPKTLLMAHNIATEMGINYCYTGNIHNDPTQTTYCPSCSIKLIERDWHSVRRNSMTNSNCSNCGQKIPGVF